MHTEVTRNDAALRTIFGWEHAPRQDSYKSYFSKFNQAANAAVSQHFYSWLMNNINFNHLTLALLLAKASKREQKKETTITNVAGFLITISLLLFTMSG